MKHKKFVAVREEQIEQVRESLIRSEATVKELAHKAEMLRRRYVDLLEQIETAPRMEMEDLE